MEGVNITMFLFQQSEAMLTPMVYEKISALRHISVVQKEAIRHLHSSTSRQKGNSP
jgi:hypothetical protein